MKKLNYKEFYKKEDPAGGYTEIVHDELGFVYHRRTDVGDEFFLPLENDESWNRHVLPRPKKYKYNEDAPIMCLCGNKTFIVWQKKGLWETNAICTRCDREFTVHSG